jgi:hypothetical protein
LGHGQSAALIVAVLVEYGWEEELGEDLVNQTPLLAPTLARLRGSSSPGLAVLAVIQDLTGELDQPQE